MSKRSQKVSGWLLGLVVAVALGFGLLVATAKPAYALSCWDDGWIHVGSQPDEVTCGYVCRSIHGSEAVGFWNPDTGCCHCAW
jgi:hypothetical protein